MLAENGRLEDAEQFIKLALERNPESVAAHANLMSLSMTKKDFDAVDKHFEQAVALDPNNAKIYYNLGMARIAAERWQDATDAFEKSLALDDKDPNAYVQLALVAKRLDKPEATIRQHLVQALEIDRMHQFGNWLLGELIMKESPTESVELLQRAVQTSHPMLPLMYAALANAFAEKGDWDEAFDAAKKGDCGGGSSAERQDERTDG